MYPTISIGGLGSRAPQLQAHMYFDPYQQTARAQRGIAGFDPLDLLNPVKLGYDLASGQGAGGGSPAPTAVFTPQQNVNQTEGGGKVIAKVNVTDALALRSSPVVDQTEANVIGWLKPGEFVEVTGKQSGIFVSVRTQSGADGWAAHVSQDGKKEYLIPPNQPIDPPARALPPPPEDKSSGSGIFAKVALAVVGVAGAAAAYAYG